jgi:putative tributyrin esterase
LLIGAKYGSRFRGLSGHSSITSLPQMKLFVEEDLANYQQPDPTDEDVLATILRHRAQLPPIRFDCGTADQLIDHNRRLHQALEEQGVPHAYEEFPGGHEWAYWEAHISKSLRFFSAQLG